MTGEHSTLVADSTARGASTYVYCVIVGPRAPNLVGVPDGLWGTGRPRLVDAADGYRLLVTSAPRALYGAAVIDERLGDLDWVGERATEHEMVVEYATSLGTVLPMKLFTLFSNDDRAKNHVRKLKRSLDRVVDRIAGCDEWGLRVLCDPARAASAANAAETLSNDSADSVSGTSFLRRKKAFDDERRRAVARRAATVDELYERVAKHARDAHRRAVPSELGAGIALDSVFLVPRESVKKLKATVAAWARSVVDDGFEVNLSGPWPVYSFIEER